jgi:hypothetical protein
MRMHHLFKPVVTCLCLLALSVCQGCGSSNPMQSSNGSSASSAVNYYSSNFDKQANVNEWQSYKRGGSGMINSYLDSLAFLSQPNSLAVSVTGSVFADSLVYTACSFQPAKDIWLEFDWLLFGMSGESEVVLNLGAVNRASIGYNANGIYLTNNGTRNYLSQGLSKTTWHHVRMVVSGGTNFSSYWLDGINIGTNESTALSPVGEPAGDYVGIKLVFNPGDVVHLDNVQAYHL